MRKPEQRLWDRMSKQLGERGVHLLRVENVVAAGFPDVIALACGIVTACELKAVESAPARSTTPVLGAKGLSIVQRNWAAHWRKHGGRQLFIVGIGAEVFAVTGHFAEEINQFTKLDFESLAVAHDWFDIAKIMHETL